MAVQSRNLMGDFFGDPHERIGRSQVNDLKLGICDCLSDSSEVSMNEDSCTSYDCSSACLIGRRLAVIADDLNDEYSSQLTRVFRQIGLGFSSSSLRWLRSFTKNILGWRRTVIVVLLGCHAAFHVTGIQEKELISKVVHFLVQSFFRRKCSFNHDGWTGT